MVTHNRKGMAPGSRGSGTTAATFEEVPVATTAEQQHAKPDTAGVLPRFRAAIQTVPVSLEGEATIENSGQPVPLPGGDR